MKLIFLASFIFGFGYHVPINAMELAHSNYSKNSSHEIVLNHSLFKISYSKKHRLANSVQYVLTKEDLQNEKGKRVDRFRADPLLVNEGVEPVQPTDYYKTGYDRGHLAPAGDFKRTQAAVDSTFVMSNMVPQKPNLNRQAWRFLEERIRTWACGEQKLFIVTGPILNESLPSLPKDISIPDRFYKAVYDQTPPVKSICFIYSQDDDKSIFPEDRMMSVDDCEQQIGFELNANSDFKSTESVFDIRQWVAKKCQ